MVKRDRLAPTVLDSTRDSRYGAAPYRGKKRKNSPANDRRREDRKRQGITKEGSDSSTYSQGVGKRRSTNKSGEGDSLRKIVREFERGDKRTRGRAKELGLKYPDTYCAVHNGDTFPHFFIETSPASGVFTCRYCFLSKWQPNSMQTAIRFGNRIRNLGLQEAYYEEVDLHPSARRLLHQLKKE